MTDDTSIAVSNLPQQSDRAIVFSRWVRRSDNTIRPEAFSPHPHTALSVTHHDGLSEDEIWELARDVATARRLTLHGRADIACAAFVAENLSLHRSSPPRNHINVRNWPDDKPGKLIIALKLAAKATYRIPPSLPVLPSN